MNRLPSPPPLSLALALCLAACQPAASPTAIPATAVPPTTTAPPPTTVPASATPAPTAGPLSPTEAEALIADQAREVVQALQDQDLRRLATHLHPERGLRFSPYPFVSEADLVFQAEQLQVAWVDGSTYTWGVADGSGAPITLTVPEYWGRFVYSQAFIDAPQVGYNTPLGTGNMLDNSRAFYPAGLIVEYHFPGFDPSLGGMDWQSLRLVFEKIDGAWYLVGIIHAQWTI